MCQYHAKVAQLKMWLYPKNKNAFLTDLKNCNFDTTWFHFFLTSFISHHPRNLCFFFLSGLAWTFGCYSETKKSIDRSFGHFFFFFSHKLSKEGLQSLIGQSMWNCLISEKMGHNLWNTLYTMKQKHCPTPLIEKSTFSIFWNSHASTSTKNQGISKVKKNPWG